MRWSSAIAWALCALLIGCVGAFAPCDVNQDCTGGQACIAGICETLCTTDAHCPQDSVCKAETCVPGARSSSELPDLGVQNEEPIPPVTVIEACDSLGTLYSSCPALPFACPDEAIARCIVDEATAFTGYCEIESSTDGCAEGSVDYCTIRACFGDDFDECMDAREATCACEYIEAAAAHCVGYGYDCTAHPAEQSWCFAAVLEEHDDPCFMFTEPDIRCAFGQPTLEGDASCKIQACFDIDTYDGCYEDLEMVCWLAP